MTAQNCVHLHARVVVLKPEFSVVDKRKIALVNELRNFRTVTQCGYPQVEFRNNYARARDGWNCGFNAKNPNRITA